MVVKWSACYPSTLTIRVRIPMKPKVFLVKFVFVKNKNKQKQAGVGPFIYVKLISKPRLPLSNDCTQVTK